MFDLIMISGDSARMFIHFEKNTTKLSEYHWNSTEDGDQRLAITPLER